MREGKDLHSGDAVRNGQLRAEDFLLGNEEFVERCANVYSLTSTDLTHDERTALVDALKVGRSRLEVVEAIEARVWGLGKRITTQRAVKGLTQPFNGYIILDVLERYAPDDAGAFTKEAYFQLLGREPTALELLEAKFDLMSSERSRRDFIKALAARNPHCRLSPEDGQIQRVNGVTLSETGDSQIVFLKYAPTIGWIFASDMWRQPIRVDGGVLQVSPGYVVTGPKRSLPTGRWNLHIDFLQADQAELIVDVVANGGLDILTRATLVGPACATVGFDIEHLHHFVEVRLEKPSQPSELCWLKPRELSMTGPREIEG